MVSNTSYAVAIVVLVTVIVGLLTRVAEVVVVVGACVGLTTVVAVVVGACAGLTTVVLKTLPNESKTTLTSVLSVCDEPAGGG